MAAPLGQSVPSLCGLRGSPSMLTIFSSFTWISVAHPTEQKGQMLGTTFASLMRSSCARARAGATLFPGRPCLAWTPSEVVPDAEENLIARPNLAVRAYLPDGEAEVDF